MPKSFRNAEVSPEQRKCTIKDCVWTYREYGIKKNGGKTWYVWYYDAAKGERQRHSLFTEDLNVAQERVINMANGIDPEHLGGDPIVYDIMQAFVDTFPSQRPPIDPPNDGAPLKPWQRSKRPRINHNHRVWKMMKPTFAALTKNKRISELHTDLQGDILKHLSKRGYVVSSISLMTSLLSRALTWAATPDRHGIIKSRHRPPVIRKHKTIAKIVDRAVPKPDNYSPRRDEFVRLILAISHHEPTRRWLLLMITFGCRVEAAAEATSEQLVGSIFLLNPKDRPEEENKVRPELPVAWSALKVMQSWGEGEWVGIPAGSIGYQIRKVRDKIGLPKLKATSIRDYIATMLRHAHVQYGVRKIDKEERLMWQGHAFEPDETNDGYGEVLPEFYLRAKIATEAMLRDLDFRSGGALFRQGADKTPLQEYAALEDFEKSGLLGVNTNSELPQETKVFIGPNREKTGNFEPLQGVFRQISDNKVRRPDGTIDALASYGRLSIEHRLMVGGVTIYEPVPGASASNGDDVYLVASGGNFIPAARAGALDPQNKLVSRASNRSSSEGQSPTVPTGSSEALKAFEKKMTRLYNRCRNEHDVAAVDAKFDRGIHDVLLSMLALPDAKPELDFGGWTSEQLDQYVAHRLAHSGAA